jgi:hypothetical protein
MASLIGRRNPCLTCICGALLLISKPPTLCAAPNANAQAVPTPIEQRVSCLRRALFFKEPRVLRLWAWLAEGHNNKKLETYIHGLQAESALEAAAVSTRDGRELRGWRLSAPHVESKTAVLVVLGNVATADIMVQRLEPLTHQLNHDFFIFDYRGYARSKPR